MANKKLIILFVLLLFTEFVIAECTENQVNINTASAEELDRIKWVGPSTAMNIINSRPFNSLDDLLNVYGIGEIKLNDIKAEGIACVGEDSGDSDEENSSEEEEENETKVIYVNISAMESPEETKKEAINLNSKNINSDSSSLFKGKYALIGLIIFLVLITFLVLIKYRIRDKNEFRG